MAGNKEGAAKAVETNIRKYGENFYVEIGRRGGKAPTTKKKGFAANPDLAKRAGKIGGARSRRTKGDSETV